MHLLLRPVYVIQNEYLNTQPICELLMFSGQYITECCNLTHFSTNLKN